MLFSIEQRGSNKYSVSISEFSLLVNVESRKRSNICSVLLVLVNYT